MRWLGNRLKNDGYAIYTPTLPGHGTSPRDLFSVSYREWIAAAEAALSEARLHHQHVFLGGLSMGGALALHLAARLMFDGVITMAAPVRLPIWDEIGARSLHRLMPWRHKRDAADINDRSALVHFQAYQAYPTRAAAELFDLLREVRRLLPAIRMPILILHGQEDHVVPVSNARRIYRNVRSAIKKLVILPNSYHLLTWDHDKETVYREIRALTAAVLSRRRPETSLNLQSDD